MDVRVSARNCQVPHEIARLAERRVGKLSKYHVRANSAEVTFSEKKRRCEVEVVVRIDGAPNVVAKGGALDFRSALDDVTNRLGRNLKRLRERSRNHRATAFPESSLNQRR